MTQLEIDRETYLIYPLFALGAAATLGIVSTDILPWVDLGETVLTFGTIDWTLGRLVSIGALVAVIVNRDAPIADALGALELWVFYATVGLILAPPFFPAFAETLAARPASFIAFTVQSIGFVVITYIN
ncbi:hypothetical protein [Halovenus marina]|uniref:hypothetical protein n=1 Tax=Halovenus marina TaxID=3396621 RepID=UPI003F552312